MKLLNINLNDNDATSVYVRHQANRKSRVITRDYLRCRSGRLTPITRITPQPKFLIRLKSKCIVVHSESHSVLWLGLDCAYLVSFVSAGNSARLERFAYIVGFLFAQKPPPTLAAWATRPLARWELLSELRSSSFAFRIASGV